MLRVNSPASIAGDHAAGAATFGPPLTPIGVTSEVNLALDEANAAGPSMTDACSALTNAAAVSGKIALVDRGTCAFVTKVKNAQNAGAVAVIVVNNVAGPPANMGGVDPSITIPSVMISQADGSLIKAALGSGPVIATLTAIEDEQPPTLTVPENMTVNATSPAGAAVTYVVSASDNVDPSPVVSCTPASGETFPIGTTTVTCTATDAAGNSTEASFQVTVKLLAVADVNPKLLNRKARGAYVTAYIEAPTFDVAAIDVATVTLQAIDPVTSVKLNVAAGSPTELGDGNGNGVLDRMVKFDRATVESWFATDGSVTLRVEGRLLDGRTFTADDNAVRVRVTVTP